MAQPGRPSGNGPPEELHSLLNVPAHRRLKAWRSFSGVPHLHTDHWISPAVDACRMNLSRAVNTKPQCRSLGFLQLQQQSAREVAAASEGYRDGPCQKALC